MQTFKDWLGIAGAALLALGGTMMLVTDYHTLGIAVLVVGAVMLAAYPVVGLVQAHTRRRAMPDEGGAPHIRAGDNAAISINQQGGFTGHLHVHGSPQRRLSQAQGDTFVQMAHRDGPADGHVGIRFDGGNQEAKVLATDVRAMLAAAGWTTSLVTVMGAAQQPTDRLRVEVADRSPEVNRILAGLDAAHVPDTLETGRAMAPARGQIPREILRIWV